MCNIYKNNLIILSQLEESQFIYYKEDTNKIKIDNRTLSYFRSGTEEKKIGEVINSSFINMFNNYIINIANSENLPSNLDNISLTASLEDSIKEIKNTKELLNKSLQGINTYYETLQLNDYKYQPILELYQKLTDLFNNIDTYQQNYIQTINKKKEKNNNSNSWLYNIYQSTLKSNSNTRVVVPELKIDVEELPKLESDYDLDSESESEKCSCEHIKDTESYILGFIYILGRKMSNIFFSITNHVRIIFR
jgi:hypothetical protein